jgi:hypothetical protein
MILLHNIKPYVLGRIVTIFTFEQLSEIEQLKVLMGFGRVISERRDGEKRQFLYYLGSFYVSVQYDVLTDEMMSIEAFEHIGRKERIEWKVLRVLPDLRKSHGNLDNLL